MCLFLTNQYYLSFFFFFFNDTATTEIYTLSLHDALPICSVHAAKYRVCFAPCEFCNGFPQTGYASKSRSEEHTSELQSQSNLVCRLLLEKKKKIQKITTTSQTRYQQLHGNNHTVYTQQSS